MQHSKLQHKNSYQSGKSSINQSCKFGKGMHTVHINGYYYPRNSLKDTNFDIGCLANNFQNSTDCIEYCMYHKLCKEVSKEDTLKEPPVSHKKEKYSWMCSDKFEGCGIEQLRNKKDTHQQHYKDKNCIDFGILHKFHSQQSSWWGKGYSKHY